LPKNIAKKGQKKRNHLNMGNDYAKIKTIKRVLVDEFDGVR
jgi:hypothetical protein